MLAEKAALATRKTVVVLARLSLTVGIVAALSAPAVEVNPAIVKMSVPGNASVAEVVLMPAFRPVQVVPPAGW